MTRDGRLPATSAPRGVWLRPSGRSVTPLAVSHSVVFHTGPRSTPNSRTILGLVVKLLMSRRIFFAMVSLLVPNPLYRHVGSYLHKDKWIV